MVLNKDLLSMNFDQSKVDVLFCSYGGGHVAMLAPVAKFLEQRGCKIDFFALTTARRYLDELGISSFGYADLPESQVSATGWAEHVALENAPSGGPVSQKESLAYHRVNLLELARTYGEQEAATRFRTFGRHSFLPVEAMRSVLSRLRPRLVVATNSPRTERALVQAAGDLGIPAVCVVDLFALQEVSWIGVPNYARRICVINEAVKATFISRGRREDEVVVTGNPAFDKLFDPQVEAAGRVLKEKRGWGSDRKTILWASQVEPLKHPFSDVAGDPSLPRRIETVLREFVKDNAEYRLVIRYHPSEQVGFEPDENVFFSPTAESLPAVIHAVDLVVVTASTVGIEANLMGRPVISVDCSIFRKDAPFSKMGVSAGVPQPEDLPGAIRGMTVTRNQGERLGGLGKRTTSATEKVARTITELLAKQG
jgi:hypothetical protein